MPKVKPKKPHWSIRWACVKWPAMVKAASAVVAIAGGIGTILGVSGSFGSAVHKHDEAIKVKALAEQERVQRDKLIDSTLKYHGQQIWTIDKKIDDLGKGGDDIKHKLDRVVEQTKDKS